jgi:hypothetical protein
MQTKSLFIPCAVAMFLSVTACDSKISQCNKLIDAVNKHTQALSTSIEKLADVQTNPAVADDFAKVVKTANDEITALEFKDEKVSGFKKEYLNLLGEADKVGKSMADAAKTNNVDTLTKAVAEADGLVKMEDKIVNDVNGYCQGS